MSCSYTFRCGTHAVEGPEGWNIGDIALQQLYRHRAQVIALLKLHDIFDSLDWHLGDWTNPYHAEPLMRFLVEHIDCRMEVVDEYGKLYYLDPRQDTP